MTCEQVRRDAAGLASLAPGDPERDAAFAHARGCAACAAALREGERLVALIDALPPDPALSGAGWRRAAAPVLEDLPQAPPRVVLPAAALAAALVATAAARVHSGAPGDWVAAAALAVAAAAIAAFAARGLPSLAAAVVASLAFAVAGAGAGPLTAEEGVRCLATELATAAVPLVAALALSRRGGGVGAARLAAAAAAGALAGQAALEVGCHAPKTFAHLLAFHVGGVLAAAAAGALAGARVAARASRA